MNPSITNRKLAKIRFFVIYTLSVLLIVLLLSSFLIPGGGANEPAEGGRAEAKRAEMIELLHRRISPLQRAALSIREKGATAAALQDLEAEKAGFMTLIDSLQKETGGLRDEKEKAGSAALLQQFALTAEREHRLAKTSSAALPDAATSAGNGSAAELDQLKTMLVQKEARINELVQQKEAAENEKAQAPAALQNRPSAPQNAATLKNDPAAAEWKDRYNKLKAVNDRNASQLETLKGSYKEVVEDNRRLIAQLQAARSGKN